MNPAELSDEHLLAATRAGDRDAFAQLVERHQQMVCAVAFARTGSFAVSEDLAQETFLAAWRRLLKKGAPDNFRAWLCGTARNLAARFHRDTPRVQPLLPETADEGRNAREQLARSEDEAMVWGALAELPETYREPLIMYFRQGQSSREVAGALGLSEQAVRQRLSRGRAMLQEAVRSRVESTLIESGPGRKFAASVVAAIPLSMSAAQAATVGGAVKGGTLAGSAALSLLATVGSGMLVGWLGIRMSQKAAIADAKSEEERVYLRQRARTEIGLVIAYCIALGALIALSRPMLRDSPAVWGAGFAGAVVMFGGGMMLFGVLTWKGVQSIRREHGHAVEMPQVSEKSRAVYRSDASFLGIPLVHVNFVGARGRAGVAFGWIAIGGIALSPFLAIGGIAVGSLSLGGLGVGLLCWAGTGLGLFSFSGISVGWIAVGGLAIGYIAYGGLAWAWHLAAGGSAIAREFALGGRASAPHANDSLARAAAEQFGWLPTIELFVQHAWALQVFVVLPMMLLIFRLRLRRSGR